jgi:hypothetical protein
MIKSGEDFSNGGRVRDHTDGSHDLSKITTWNDGGWLIVNTNLETSWAPINELDGSLGLDGGNSGIDVLWYDITSIHHRASHVFTMSWVTLGHHIGWFES